MDLDGQMRVRCKTCGMELFYHGNWICPRCSAVLSMSCEECHAAKAHALETASATSVQHLE